MKPDKSSNRALYVWFLQVIIFWCLLSIFIWLALKPKHPIYKVVDVQISHSDDRSLTLFNNGWNSTIKSRLKSGFHGGSSSTYQNISIIIMLEISNPNKRIGIYHDDINVALYQADHYLVGNNSVAGFHQGYRNITSCKVEVKSKLQFERIMQRRVDLRICLKTGVRYDYDIFRYRKKRHQMDIESYITIGSENRNISSGN